MKRYLVLLLAAIAAPATACLPPPPGWTERLPTPEQRAHEVVRYSTDIVYGVLTRGTYDRGGGRLRILHVYKGTLRAGQSIAVSASWGLDPPLCAGMLSGPPPVERGAYGVVAWSGEPALNFVPDERLEAMFRLDLIRRARPQRVGTGSTPE